MQAQDEDERWEQVFSEDFTEGVDGERWRLDGFAGLEIVEEGDARFLRVATRPAANNPLNKQSVLWCGERFSGDLRFRFRAKAEAGNRCIFYFNAGPTEESGYGSIFDRARPDAQMVRYAGNPNIEMYSVGILRDDEERCNLRYIGGTMADAFNRVRPGSEEEYGKVTIFQSYPSPFRGRPDVWFEFDLQVVGRRIAMLVDGVQVFDVEDKGTAGPEDSRWTSLTSGGFIGFRNFVPTAACIDFVKVYRRA